MYFQPSPSYRGCREFSIGQTGWYQSRKWEEGSSSKPKSRSRLSSGSQSRQDQNQKSESWPGQASESGQGQPQQESMGSRAGARGKETKTLDNDKMFLINCGTSFILYCNLINEGEKSVLLILPLMVWSSFIYETGSEWANEKKLLFLFYASKSDNK